MKKKIIYGLLAIVLLVDIIITAVVGLRVSLYYGEGYTISFSEKSTIEKADIEQIAKDVFEKDYLVQNVEFYNDSALIKVKNVSDEQLSNLATKLNEKYSSTIESSDLKVEHVQNVKIRSIVEPYVLPLIIATLLILAFYAVRYRGSKQMLGLLKYLVIAEALLYSAYAICRVPVNTMSMPVAFTLYGLVILVYTFVGELKKSK